MALYMADTKKLLKKISKSLYRNYRKLKVDGRNGSGIALEEVHERDIMQGYQLFGHPVFKEIKESKGKDN